MPDMLTFRSRRAAGVLAALLATFLLVACGDDGNPPTSTATPVPGTATVVATETTATATQHDANLTHGCVEEFDPETDYFPERVELRYAANFSVEYHDSYKVVTVFEPRRGDPAEQYVLVQCGAPLPELEGTLAGAALIEVPITSMFSGGTPGMTLLANLDRLEVLQAVARPDSVNNPAVRARLDSGDISAYADAGEINLEYVIAEAPAILLTGGTEQPDQLASLQSAGVAVVSDAAWLEGTALGRAEWIKFMGLFLNGEAQAAAIFDEIESNYLELSQLASAIPEEDRPLVMSGFIFNGLFYAAGGASYMADIIEAAGGRYVWADDDTTASLMLDIEEQIDRALDADFWISQELNDWSVLADVLDVDPRLGEFKAYRDGEVWVNRLRVNETGGNEFWERAPAFPHLMLADLIAIFHPDLVPDHTLEWYLRVPEE